MTSSKFSESYVNDFYKDYQPKRKNSQSMKIPTVKPPASELEDDFEDQINKSPSSYDVLSNLAGSYNNNSFFSHFMAASNNTQKSPPKSKSPNNNNNINGSNHNKKGQNLTVNTQQPLAKKQVESHKAVPLGSVSSTTATTAPSSLKNLNPQPNQQKTTSKNNTATTTNNNNKNNNSFYHQWSSDDDESSSESGPGVTSNATTSALSSSFHTPLSQLLTKTTGSSNDKAQVTSKEEDEEKKEILLFFLLQEVCKRYNPSPIFFANVCRRFVESGYLSETRFSDIEALKKKSKDFLNEFVINWPPADEEVASIEDTSRGLKRSSSDPVLSVFGEKNAATMLPVNTNNTGSTRKANNNTTSPASNHSKHLAMFSRFPFYELMFHSPSRYSTDFVEIQALGKGGFGSVFRARHRIDGHEYAIKKVKIRFRNVKELEIAYSKVIREVQSLAALDHPNIVRYNQAWFEPCRGDDQNNDDEDGEEEDSEDEEERDGEEEHRSADTDATDLSSASENTCDRSQSNQMSLLTAQLNKNHNNDSLFEFEYESEESSAKCKIEDYVPNGNESEESSPIRTQKVYPASPSPNGGSFLEHYMRNGEPPRRASIVATNTGASTSTTPVSDQSMKAVKGLLLEMFNEKNQKFEMVLYIQMQLCMPGTLEDWMWSESRTKRQEVDMRHVLFYFKQIVEGISHVHENGLIHRDIKPSNIFIGHDDKVKIGDFGLAKCIKENLPRTTPPTPTTPFSSTVIPSPATTTSATSASSDSAIIMPRIDYSLKLSSSSSDHTSGVGTYFYASPEQRNGKNYDEKSDIFSLGIILFEMLHPFATRTERAIVLKNLREKNMIPPHLLKMYPSEMELVKKCISKAPAERPHAVELYAYVNRLCTTRGIIPEVPENSNTTSKLEQLLLEKDSQLKAQEEMIKKLQTQIEMMKLGKG